MLLKYIFSFLPALALILTPKEDTFVIKNEFNLETIATVNDITFYKTNSINYQKNKQMFDNTFDVEEEQIYTIQSVIKSVPWHLSRITQRDLPLKYIFNHTHCNTNPDVTINNYVIDTGIDVSHYEFEGRAVWLSDFSGGSPRLNSHGTHCAGSIGGKTVGVCPDAHLFSIRVLDENGSGSTSGVLAGIEDAYNHHLRQNSQARGIINMSLGGGKSIALNKAVLATLRNPRFYVVAAAGNENSDSCNTSPASVPDIFTVMASDIKDNRAYFSNYGLCSDIYSPGVDILSTIPGGKLSLMSGSSMAGPQVVGVLNHYLNKYPDLNNKQLKDKVLEDSSKNKIRHNVQNTNNYLIYLE